MKFLLLSQVYISHLIVMENNSKSFKNLTKKDLVTSK